MTRHLIAGFVFLLAMQPISAREEMASEATIREILVTTRFQALMDTQRAQLEEKMRLSLQNALSKETLNAAQKEILVKRQKELAAIVLEAVSYDYLEPIAIDMYQKTFTDREAADILAFYKSPAGQVLVEKMPLVMNQIMQVFRDTTEKMEPKIREWKRETMEQLKAARSGGDPASGVRP
jgi:uncharacterized protein